jgi:hypothetical protein
LEAAPSVLTSRQLNRALLARQMLLARETVTVRQAITHLVGLQAQVARPPFVGLWTRMNGFAPSDLLGPVRRRRVVRATSMRGTLHLMTATDFLAFRGPLQAALDRGLSVLGARGKTLDRAALEKAGRSFFGKGPAEFEALRASLGTRHPEADIRAMAYRIRMTVPLVQVPSADRWGYPSHAEFALADDWLGKTVAAQPAPADAMVKRYLAAFGPASVADAQAWSGLPGLREVFERLRPGLVTFRDERRRELFDLPRAPRPAADTPAPVRFMPEFDNLILSHKDRTRIIADADRPKVTLKNLQVRATFLVDGMVAGTWSMARKKKQADLVLEPFGRLPKSAAAALAEEGERLLRFLGETGDVRQKT